MAAGYGGLDHETILKATKTPEGAVDFFVELHIEQGPLLEKVRVLPAACALYDSFAPY